ncbi:PIN domain-containing protein [uncultured Ruegeria sp.]|uniref:type II toxin-antitoxin system VapC family toxin n=1 Tax=uncultured Ruegeria sp. TaxID=259304 RepID=UPI00261FADC1|nr:PIN domain-containing protein [uncultured Ruegeria sp.]
MTHLIDTVEIFRIVGGVEDGDPLLEAIKEVSQNGKLFISVVSHGEILSQIERVPDEALRKTASQNYKQLIASIGSTRLVSFDSPVAAKWATLTSQFSAEDYPDASSEAIMVAATAEYFGYTLICQEEGWHKFLKDTKFLYV